MKGAQAADEEQKLLLIAPYRHAILHNHPQITFPAIVLIANFMQGTWTLGQGSQKTLGRTKHHFIGECYGD
jgi:hypothetical protein